MEKELVGKTRKWRNDGRKADRSKALEVRAKKKSMMEKG